MTTLTSQPKWATPDRRTALIQLFVSSGGFCVFGHKNCLIPEHHYTNFIEDLIKDWKEQDREFRQALWEAELKAMHHLGERNFPLRGQFSAISKDIFASNQPLYYFDGQAISGVSLTPFVRVRIASSYVRLYIDLGEALREVSKTKRRKAIRYGKALPIRTEERIRLIILEAVRHYLAH